MVVARLANAFFCSSRSRYFSGIVAMAWLLAAAASSSKATVSNRDKGIFRCPLETECSDPAADRLPILRPLAFRLALAPRPASLCQRRARVRLAPAPCAGALRRSSPVGGERRFPRQRDIHRALSPFTRIAVIRPILLCSRRRRESA